MSLPRAVKALALPAAMLAAAQLWAATIGITSDSLASPAQVAVAWWQAAADGSLWLLSGQTLAAAGGGLLLGGGAGLAFGVALGLSAPLARLLQVPVDAIRAVPSIALLPVALLVFGFGYRMEVWIVAFACFWPVLIIGQAAIGGIDPMLLDVSRVLGLGPVARIGKVVLPAAWPRLFVAFRLAAGIALIVAVTVEIAANPSGLGYGLMIAQQTLHPAGMFALLAWLGLLGWALNAVLVRAQHALFGRLRGAGA